MNLVQGLCRLFWGEGLVPVLWWVELSLPSDGQGCVQMGYFGGICELSMTLGSLYADEWGCIPILLVVWYEVSSTGSL